MQDPSLFKSQRVGIFVDVQSLYLASRNTPSKTKINYEILLKEVLNGRSCARVVAYVQEKREAECNGFARAMYEKGFEIRTKSPMGRADVPFTWSVGMTLDMLDTASRLDTVVIVSHDPSLEESIRYLSLKGVGVEVWGFESDLGVLKKAAPKFHFLQACLENDRLISHSK